MLGMHLTGARGGRSDALPSVLWKRLDEGSGDEIAPRRNAHPESRSSATAESSPKITVVVPSHRREARLAFALDALVAQTVNPKHFEVLSSGQAGRSTQGRWRPTASPSGSLESPARGPAAQRNLGWRSARAPLAAFTDDDCRRRRAGSRDS